MRFRRTIQFLLLFFFPLFGFSQSIDGYVRTEKGEPLGFASIFVEENTQGTTTNEDGYFLLNLSPGEYTIHFQYVGYESFSKRVKLGKSRVTLNVQLKERTILLNEVFVSGEEDPAYTVMRKAIAKSKYHKDQVDSMSIRVYIKGSGKLKKVPFLLRNRLSKLGIDKDRLYVTESVSEIQYKRPDIIEERVISIRSSGNDNNTDPMIFILGSFYNPEIGGAISPLSPKAFNYYKFEYLELFEDRGYSINKIRVIPRVKTDNLFSGIIYIVEDYWSLYGVDVSTVKLGLSFKIHQSCNPVKDDVWLPTSQKYDITGSIMGVDFEYQYLSSLSDFYIEINPNLPGNFEVIDEKIESVPDTLSSAGDVLAAAKNGDAVTTSQLRKAMKNYDGEKEKGRMMDPKLISKRTFTSDSANFILDSSYWNSIRSVPLSREELEGYQVTDSLAERQKNKEERRNRRLDYKKFQVHDLIIGGRYKLNDKNFIRLRPAYYNLNFNTVEGYHFDYSASWRHEISKTKKFYVRPYIRYGFSSQTLYPKLMFEYDFDIGSSETYVYLEGGKYVSQFNSSEPIPEIINTFSSLLLRRNRLKIYQEEFIELKLRQNISPRLSFKIGSEFAWRTQLFNATEHSWFDIGGNEYTPNAPQNIEVDSTDFPTHKKFDFALSLVYKPWQVYREINGVDIPVRGSSPEFTFTYRQGMPDILGSVTDFSALEASANYSFDVGPASDMRLIAYGGKFLNTDSLFFMDFRHFMGNQTFFVTSDPVENFRLLEYYEFSTKDKYIAGHVNYQTGKLLLTQFSLVQNAGLRENLFTNYLYTPQAGNYIEFGYAVDYIFRLFRVELVTSLHDGKADFGFLFGLALGVDFFNRN